VNVLGYSISGFGQLQAGVEVGFVTGAVNEVKAIFGSAGFEIGLAKGYAPTNDSSTLKQEPSAPASGFMDQVSAFVDAANDAVSGFFSIGTPTLQLGSQRRDPQN
jgi:hypothetical protein